MGTWTGILEHCWDIHPFEEDMNLVLHPSKNLSVWPLARHLRPSEVKRHPPIHSKAAFPREPKSLLPHSCLLDLRAVCDSIFLLRKDNRSWPGFDRLRRQDSKIHTNDTQKWVRQKVAVPNNQEFIYSHQYQKALMPAVVPLKINGPLRWRGAADCRLTAS